MRVLNPRAELIKFGENKMNEENTQEEIENEIDKVDYFFGEDLKNKKNGTHR